MKGLLFEGSRFVAVGVINTLVGFATIVATRHFLGASEFGANACGYAVGLFVGFVLNRRWTFERAKSHGRAGLRYVCAFAMSYALNLLVLAALLRAPSIPPLLAQAVAMLTYTGAFFVSCRTFVFRHSDAADSLRS